MNELNKLAYFLHCMKNVLSFKDKKDFKELINESKEFRIKVQKLVYMSKFLGWNNHYNFALAERGPYSVELKHDYLNNQLFDVIPEKIDDLNESVLLKLFENRSLLFFEAISTILYTIGKNIVNISENDCVLLIQSIKEHIPSYVIIDAFVSIKNFDLDKINISLTNDEVKSLENDVLNKIDEFTDYFDRYEGSRNKIIVLGSIDYMRIAVRESNLNLYDKFELLTFIGNYLRIIEKISIEINSDELIDVNLDYLEELFDQFQDYVSGELKIIKRIDDDDFDETLCY
ncbi:MAG: hypothetical protein IJ258_09265 [Methanobrevibacter sp.]|uniref:hypothetical protein n=1 Tax=Methanobrevibacter sp. TaxID=66852 RepID=UPI0025DEB292|nr:hypothetical protein [Methanobrevibacter sp.]MBQ8018275.1 hypothetical protein [Methanobrevibacter sp.]